MINQILNVIVIMVVLTPIISITIFNNQSTNASSDDGTSIAPIYRDGYEVGKVQGREDHIGGNEHDDRCPPENGDILWCIGYEMGYNDYYNTSEILGRKR
jgi:hypothetical protein